MKTEKGIIEKGDNLGHKKVILARHGSTKLNVEGDKIRGWLNVPLDEQGLKEAHELGERLKKEDFDVIVCSDLDRAIETAQIISEITDKPIEGKTSVLRPWDVGELTGKESKAVIPKMMEYVNNHPDEKVPEGESFNDFKNRFLDGIERIVHKFENKVVLVVAHHRNERMLEAWIADGCKSDGSFNAEVFNQKGFPPGDYKVFYIK